MPTATLTFVGALIVTLAAQPLLVRWMGRVLLDQPNARSGHHRPTPRVGGMGIMIGLLASVPLAGWSAPLGAAWMLGVLGLIDDLRPLPVPLRLGAQFGVAAATTAVVVGGWACVPLTVLVVAYINAFNFMDGVNGISGFTALVVGASWAYAGVVYQAGVVTGLALALAGAAAGFLPLNLRGKVFLGDSGSYAFGAVISGTAVVALAAGVPWPVVLGPLVVYFADTGVTLIMRLVRGENVLQAHRQHTYQRLTDRGLTGVTSAVVVACASAITAAGGWWMRTYPAGGLAIWAVVTVAYLALPSLLLNRSLSNSSGAGPVKGG